MIANEMLLNQTCRGGTTRSLRMEFLVSGRSVTTVPCNAGIIAPRSAQTQGLNHDQPSIADAVKDVG